MVYDMYGIWILLRIMASNEGEELQVLFHASKLGRTDIIQVIIYFKTSPHFFNSLNLL